MKQNYTHIAMILDRSYSMLPISKSTIDGYNQFIQEQKNVPGKATFTLVKFDHEYDITGNFSSINDVQLLDESTYVPRGGTALYDAIGFTIKSIEESIQKLDEKPDSVVVCILTDGEENRSSEFSDTDIKSLIQQKENDGWHFNFIGANQDAIYSATKIGIKAPNSITYASNDLGTRSAFSSLSHKYSTYRVSNSVVDLAFDENDVKIQMNAGLNEKNSNNELI